MDVLNRAALAILPLAALLPLAARAAAAPPDAAAPKIRAVEPARTDSLLVCWIRTSGLPDPLSRETLASGLPSSLVLGVRLLDGAGTVDDGVRVEVRIEPDLWEGDFLVKTPFADLRVASLEDLGPVLARLGPLPVRPLAGLLPETDYRIGVRLAVHPLAPSQLLRVSDLIAGEGTPRDPDRQEVSVGLGALIGFFLRGREVEPWVDDRVSPPFVPSALEEVSAGSTEEGASP